MAWRRRCGRYVPAMGCSLHRSIVFCRETLQKEVTMTTLNINLSLPAEAGRPSQQISAAPAPEPPDRLPSQAGIAHAQRPVAGVFSGAATAPAPMEPGALASMASISTQAVFGPTPPPPMDINQLAAASGRAVEMGMAPYPSRIEDVAAAAGMALPIGLPPQPIPPEELENAARASGGSGGSPPAPPRRRDTR